VALSGKIIAIFQRLSFPPFIKVDCGRQAVQWEVVGWEGNGLMKKIKQKGEGTNETKLWAIQGSKLTK